MERTFDFITDTCCGMPQEYIEAHGVTVLPLGYTIAGETYGGIEGKQLPPKEFYRLLREGNVCHTFQVTAEQAKPSVEASFKAGRDVVIVTFSSALSGTASSFTIAANELMEKYPARKTFIVDSLGGSLGEGMLLEYLVKKPMRAPPSKKFMPTEIG
ncbi:MAG: DegV family protein [Christensenellaceae bacterium]